MELRPDLVGLRDARTDSGLEQSPGEASNRSGPSPAYDYGFYRGIEREMRTEKEISQELRRLRQERNTSIMANAGSISALEWVLEATEQSAEKKDV